MTIGIDKTFNLLVPISFADSDLLYTNIPETGGEWSSATTYALGARVIRTTATTHNIYESLQAGNLNKVPENTLGTWWVIVSKTNRWKLFDNSEGSQTIGETRVLHYKMRSTKPVNAVSLHNIKGNEVYVGMIVQGEISGPTEKRNLLTPSEYLENAAFTRTNMGLDGTGRYKAPWGSYTARRVTDTTTNGAHSIAQTVTLTSTNFNSSPANASFYVKRSIQTPNVRLTIAMTGSPNLAFADFDLGAGTVISATGGTAIITALADGWYRCSVNVASPPSSTVMTMTVSMLGPANAVSYSGSLANPAALLLTGFQAEKGAAGSTAPTAYQFVHSSTQYGVRANGSVQAIPQFAGGASAPAVFTNLNGSIFDIVEVTVFANPNPPSGGGFAALGELIAGSSYPIGCGTLPVKLGIIDFSQTERNDFGNFGFGAKELVKRDAVQTVEMSVHVEADEAEAVRSLLAPLRATPFVIYDTSLISGAGITTFGIWRDFDIEVMAPDAAMLRLKMETLI